MENKKQDSIKSMMQEERKFAPPASLTKRAHINSMEMYNKMYKRSIEDSDGFWSEMAEKQVTWYKKWDKVMTWEPSKAKCQWFVGGKLNVSYNCLDRHVEAGHGDQVALIWEGDSDKESKKYTYKQLMSEVARFANVMKKHNIKKGDRVCIYLPMIPELMISMLACTRIGAIHSIVFGGFSADSLRDRILDSSCKMVVTSDGSYRGGKVIPLKQAADDARKQCPSIESVIVVKHTGNEVKMGKNELWWDAEMKSVDDKCAPEHMDAEDPLFILYTSGSTGKPKGVLHTTGGYLVYTSLTHKYIFDYQEGDIYWCTADIGWVTGHSYITYGPLCNRATTIMFEGIPTYPEADRFWAIVEKYKVNQFYTAPTAIRAIAAKGDEFPKRHNLSSLFLLGTVGEPINPEAWMWYYNTIGGGKCPIVDTWWQTETGGILITPLAGCMNIKPGSASKPFFGVEPMILNEAGKPVGDNEGGYLCIKRPWPGMMRTVYGHHERFQETYFSKFKWEGKEIYYTGDGARRDPEGDYWLMGRLDDVINVSGHRMGTAEVESALVSHAKVAEAAVVGMPHEIKGQGIYAYVTLNAGVHGDDALKKELVAHVSKEIGPIAKPDKIQFTDALPKTRSGKIMRRILKKIAANEINDLGDTTTLADPGVVGKLVENRQ